MELIIVTAPKKRAGRPGRSMEEKAATKAARDNEHRTVRRKKSGISILNLDTMQVKELIDEAPENIALDAMELEESERIESVKRFKTILGERFSKLPEGHRVINSNSIPLISYSLVNNVKVNMPRLRDRFDLLGFPTTQDFVPTTVDIEDWYEQELREERELKAKLLRAKAKSDAYRAMGRLPAKNTVIGGGYDIDHKGVNINPVKVRVYVNMSARKFEFLTGYNIYGRQYGFNYFECEHRKVKSSRVPVLDENGEQVVEKSFRYDEYEKVICDDEGKPIIHEKKVWKTLPPEWRVLDDIYLHLRGYCPSRKFSDTRRTLAEHAKRCTTVGSISKDDSTLLDMTLHDHKNFDELMTNHHFFSGQTKPAYEVSPKISSELYNDEENSKEARLELLKSRAYTLGISKF